MFMCQTVRKTLLGRQTGEYFGASLASVDVDGDGRDEIVVGAPLFNNDNVATTKGSYSQVKRKHYNLL